MYREQGKYEIFVCATLGKIGHNTQRIYPYVHIAACGSWAEQIGSYTSWRRLDNADITREYGISLFYAHNLEIGDVLTVLREIFGEVEFFPI